MAVDQIENRVKALMKCHLNNARELAREACDLTSGTRFAVSMFDIDAKGGGPTGKVEVCVHARHAGTKQPIGDAIYSYVTTLAYLRDTHRDHLVHALRTAEMRMKN
jgi:hypothetical protein